jgi:sugar phosphate permease
MSAVPIAGVLGGPLSGWIMTDFAGLYGMKGWQWMFLLEGLPTILLGLIVPLILVDKPDDAKWLSKREKDIIKATLAADQADGVNVHDHSFGQALRDPRVYALGMVYFALICGIYAISFWLPTIIKGAGVTDVLSIGLYSMIPYGVGAAGMLLIGRHSDIKMERRWHMAFCCISGAAFLVMIALTSHSLVWSLVALSLGTATIFAGMPVFWAIPTAYLPKSAAAGGIAMINSIALIGGFVSPTIMGWVKQSTGSLTNGLYVMAAVLVCGGILVLVTVSKTMLNEGPART